MAAKKVLLSAGDKKLLINGAFRCYQLAVWAARQYAKHEKIIDDKPPDVSARNVLFETISIVDPDLYEAIKAMEVPKAVEVILAYLTGMDIVQAARSVAEKGKIIKIK